MRQFMMTVTAFAVFGAIEAKCMNAKKAAQR
jgi:hypothetical protein